MAYEKCTTSIIPDLIFVKGIVLLLFFCFQYARCKCIIDRRGPDSSAEITEHLPHNWEARFAASVLWMQGAKPVQQPCVDSDGNILLWNGDIFSGCLVRATFFLRTTSGVYYVVCYIKEFIFLFIH